MRDLRPVPCVLLGASAVLALAAILRMAGPVAAGPDDATGAIRLPGPVTMTVVLLFAAAGAVLLIAVGRRVRLRRRGGAFEIPEVVSPPWLRTVKQILALLNLVVIAYLMWRGVIPLAALLSLGHGGGGLGPELVQDPPATAPFLFRWTFGALAVLAGVGMLGLALWIAFSDRLLQWWQRGRHEREPDPVAASHGEDEDGLRAEPDARRAIIRCYGRFERVAAGSGVARPPWHTPMEFMREALARLPGARASLPVLTGLFELARFSRRPLGAAERDRALDALDAIALALVRRRDDVGSR